MSNNNVFFKRGQQANLNVLANAKQAQDGCFYLTTDTHHLYIGTEDGGIAKINGNIHSIESLPTTGEQGEFYYLPGQNILAYYDNGSWVQLNPDTDTVIETTGISVSKNSNQSNNTKLVYDITLSQKKNNVNMDDVTATFEINSADVTSIVTETSVDVVASEDAQGNVTIKTSGAGSGGTGFGISGASGISVDVNNKNIKITGTEYDLSVDGKTVILEEGTNKNKKISIDGDSTWIDTGANKDTNPDGIKVSHKQKSYNNSTTGNLTATEELNFSNASTFDAVTGVTYDAAGHIDSVTTTTFSVPEIDYSLTANDTAIDPTDEDSEKYTTSLTLKNGTKVIGGTNIPIKIALPITVDGAKTILNNGDTIGSFYSAAKVDEKLKGINAMTYKGPVNSNDDLPVVSATSKIRIGDTYKVNTAGTYAEYDCKIGYLLIANTTGNENDEGYITEGLYWDLIESGESSDTTYKLSCDTNNKQIILKENNTGNAGIIQFTNDKETNEASPVISFATSETNGVISVKASHIDIETQSDNGNNTSTTLGYAGEFEAITGLTPDKHGHITGYNIKKYKLPTADTINSDKNNHTLSIKNGNDKKGGITLIGGNKITLVSTADTNNTTLNTTISHATESIQTPSQNSTPDYGATFTAISSVTTDGYGHISAITTDTVTLPEKIKYELSEVTKRNGTTVIGVDLKTGNDTNGSIDFYSDTLEIAKDTTNKQQININLTWGTFDD